MACRGGGPQESAAPVVVEIHSQKGSHFMSKKIARAGLVGASAIALAFALTGCTLLGGGAGSDRDDEGQVTDTGEDSVFNMEVGDCLNEPEGTEVSDIELVPCDQEHDYEVYDELELPEGDFPSDVDTQADEFCTEAFTEFVGLTWEESALDISWFTPTEGSWSDGDHLIQCIVLDPAGPTTGSLEGANK